MLFFKGGGGKRGLHRGDGGGGGLDCIGSYLVLECGIEVNPARVLLLGAHGGDVLYGSPVCVHEAVRHGGGRGGDAGFGESPHLVCVFAKHVSHALMADLGIGARSGRLGGEEDDYAGNV